jgi:hypothetical protein
MAEREGSAMLTFKNVVAVGLFVFGTTFLWMTRDFLANPRDGTGALWSIVQVLAFASIIGFTAAGWGVFKDSTWWEAVALASAVVGLGALLPYVIGIVQLGQQGDAGVQINIAIHSVGVAAVLAIVLLPVVHDWFARRI